MGDSDSFPKPYWAAETPLRQGILVGTGSLREIPVGTRTSLVSQSGASGPPETTLS